MFAIEVPKMFINVEIKTIIPITNDQNFEIDGKIEQLFEYKNITYTYENHKYFKDIAKSKHCILTNNCQLQKNLLMQIIKLN